jgi:hypothetical protein
VQGRGNDDEGVEDLVVAKHSRRRIGATERVHSRAQGIHGTTGYEQQDGSCHEDLF